MTSRTRWIRYLQKNNDNKISLKQADRIIGDEVGIFFYFIWFLSCIQMSGEVI